MTLPTLYIDVDGVVNANEPHQGWGKTKQGSASAEGFKYRIRWSPAMIERLSALKVRLIWATTWRRYAAQNIAPLVGWEEAAHASWLAPPKDHDYDEYAPSLSWKVDALVADQIANGPTPVIWIDDELADKDSMDQFDVLKKIAGLDIILVAPTARVGISPKDMVRIEEFISRVSPNVAE